MTMLFSGNTHEARISNRDYHEEERSTNQFGDDILTRKASDTDTPFIARSVVKVTHLERRPHIPHHHEWETWSSVENTDNDYRVDSWYALADINGETKLPRSDEGFQHDGEFSYNVMAWDKVRGVRDVNDTIDDCSTYGWILGKTKKKCNPDVGIATSYVPYHDDNGNDSVGPNSGME